MLLTYYPQFDINIYYVKIVLDFVMLALSLGFALSLFFRVKRDKSKEANKMERAIYLNLLTWGIFFLLLSIGHTFNIIHSLLSLTDYVNEDLEKLLEKLGVLIVYIAYLVKVIYIEYVINSNKYYKGYFFTPIFCIVIVLIALIDVSVLREPGFLQIIFIILMLVGFSVLPLLYLFLTFKLAGKSRLDAYKVSLGITLFGVFSVAQPPNLIMVMGISDFFDAIIEWTYIIGVIGVIVSLLILFDTFRKKNA